MFILQILFCFATSLIAGFLQIEMKEDYLEKPTDKMENGLWTGILMVIRSTGTWVLIFT